MKLVLLMLIALPTLLLAAPIITVESPLPWLHVTPGTDPTFAAAVAASIGNETADKIAAALPYSVVVTNAGSVPITGIGLLFLVSYPGAAKPAQRSFFYHNWQPSQKPIMNPGQSRVFTPFKTATLLAGNAGGGLGPNPARVEDVSVVSSAASIHVSIDLAVSSDWRMAGADASGFVANMTAQHDAFKAMHDEMLARLGSTQTDDALRAWLQSMTQQKSAARMVGDRVDRTGSLYSGEQAALARDWLAVLTQAGGRAALQSRVAQVTPATAFPGIGKLQAGLQ